MLTFAGSGKGVTKDTGEPADEELPGARSGSVQPGGAGTCHPVPGWTSSPTWRLSNLLSLGDFMGISLCRHDQSLIILSCSASLSPEWRAGLKTPTSHHGLVFPVTQLSSEGHPGATKSHLIRAKDTPSTEEMTRVSGALCRERG